MGIETEFDFTDGRGMGFESFDYSSDICILFQNTNFFLILSFLTFIIFDNDQIGSTS